MLFGSKDDFGIECHVAPPLDSTHVWGRMCVWCGGQRLGDIEDVNLLDVTEPCFVELLDGLAALTDDAVDHLSDGEAFEFLNGRLYLGLPDGSLEDAQADARRFGKFDILLHWGEQFDHVKAFLLKARSDFRVVYQRRGRGAQGALEPVGSCTVSEARIREAVTGFVGWMADQRKRLAM